MSTCGLSPWTVLLACWLALANLPGPAPGPAVDAAKVSPARGVLLVADETLRDPRFARAVVLLTHYGPKGAAGLIVNRPTAVRVVDAIPSFADYLADAAEPMFFGGPVEAGVASVLVRSKDPLPGGTPVLADVYAVNRMSVLLAHFGDAGFVARARFYGGYAGWDAGQLENEIARGDWNLTRGTVAAIFSSQPGALWEELNRDLSGLWVERGPSAAGEKGGKVCESRHESGSVGGPTGVVAI